MRSPKLGDRFLAFCRMRVRKSRLNAIMPLALSQNCGDRTVVHMQTVLLRGEQIVLT